MKVIWIACFLLLVSCHGVTEEEKTIFRLGKLDHALLSYHQATGRYPSIKCGLKCLSSNLDGVNGWKGPYYKFNGGDGKEFDGSQMLIVYKPIGLQYKLYSIGRNSVDEGGGGDDILSEGSAE